ncbi:phosphatidate cytidylyltransferase [Marinicella sp. W31]|uniref:phosphatidate cytidylyltransferase n=1 Tax=Marinicella sp. W31 TaxID=3023713 RepID=UPI003757A701
MLKQRIITAVLLAPVVLLLIFYGNQWQFAALVVLLQVMSGYEWLRMNRVPQVINVALNASLALAVFIATLQDWLMLSFQSYLIILVLLWVPALMWLKNIRWGNNDAWGHMLKTAIGLLAIVFFAISLNTLHDQPNGHLWTLILFVLIWVADTGAYISGKSFGRSKLAPAISPGKTWEGLLGGVILVAIYAWFIATLMNISAMYAVLSFPLVAVFSVAGDLCASLGKRQAGIKDSSNFLPGHGGFIDRFDSLIAAAPLFVIVLRLVS